MRRLLSSILLVMTLWLPAQAQKPPHLLPNPCQAAPLPYTPGELQDIFNTYNRQYWDGKLPKTTVIWTALKDRYGDTNIENNGSFVIRLDVLKNKEQNVAKTTLLHEMCHVKTWGEQCHVEGAKNGDCTRWLRELHRIMLEGAFDDIV